jgi:hypothetical protein
MAQGQGAGAGLVVASGSSAAASAACAVPLQREPQRLYNHRMSGWWPAGAAQARRFPCHRFEDWLVSSVRSTHLLLFLISICRIKVDFPKTLVPHVRWLEVVDASNEILLFTFSWCCSLGATSLSKIFLLPQETRPV